MLGICYMGFLVAIASVATTVSCGDFSYGYTPEDFPVALINISYIDPVTSLPKVDCDDIGRFGVGKFHDLVGVVAHVTSNNHTSHRACDRLDTDRLPQEPYIALIKHGECRDYVKMMHAAEANASGVVVYSNQLDAKLMKHGYKGDVNYISDHLPIFIINRDNPVQVHHPKLPVRNLTSPRLNSLRDSLLSLNVSELVNSEPQLPYVFISAEKGEEIASLVDNGTRVMMRIVCSTYSAKDNASVLFVSISFVFLMILMMTWVVFYYVQRFRTIVFKDQISKRLCTAAQKALERIPVKTIAASEMVLGNEDECCAVCIDSLKPNEVIRILPCQHVFHKVCVDPWLLEHRSCPMCKLDIVLHYGLVFLGSQESIMEFEETPFNQRRNSQAEAVHVIASRRNSSSQTSPCLEDRSTSTCVFVQVDEDEFAGGRNVGKDRHRPFGADDVLSEAAEDLFAAGPSGINEGIQSQSPTKSNGEDIELEEIDCN